MRPVDPAARPVDGRIAQAEAGDAWRSLGDVDEKRQVALTVERLGLAHPHRSERLDPAHGLADVGKRPRRIGIAWLGVDERAYDRRVDAFGPPYGHVANPGNRSRVDEE